jgi:hypothetical protein
LPFKQKPQSDRLLVQMKSVLDHMINVLHYTLGLDFSGLTTFGDYGNRIVNQLQKNVSKKKEGLQGAAKILIEHIQQNQWWLEVVIESRDRMNHYKNGGLSPLPFIVAYIIDADGAEQLYRPTFSPGNLVKDEMSVIFRSLSRLRLCWFSSRNFVAASRKICSGRVTSQVKFNTPSRGAFAGRRSKPPPPGLPRP